MTEAVSIVNPFPVFFDVNGNPIDNGKIYIGIAGSNPKGNTNNLINLYLDKELTVLCENPLNILDGFIVYQNKRKHIYTSAQNYAIVIDDKNGNTIAVNLNFSFETKIPNNVSGINLDDSPIGATTPSAGNFTQITASNANIGTLNATSGSINNLNSKSITTNHSIANFQKIEMISEDNSVEFHKGLINRGGLQAWDGSNFIRIYKTNKDTGVLTNAIDIYDNFIVTSNPIVVSTISQTNPNTYNEFNGTVRANNDVIIKSKDNGYGHLFFQNKNLLDQTNQNLFISAYLEYSAPQDRISLYKVKRNNDGSASITNGVIVRDNEIELVKGIRFTEQAHQLNHFSRGIVNVTFNAIDGNHGFQYERNGRVVHFTLVMSGNKNGIGNTTRLKVSGLPFGEKSAIGEFVCPIVSAGGSWFNGYENGLEPIHAIINTSCEIEFVRQEESIRGYQCGLEMKGGAHTFKISGFYILASD